MALLGQQPTPAAGDHLPTSARPPLAAGPALIQVESLTVDAQQMALQARVFVANSLALVNQLGVLSLELNALEDSDGNLQTIALEAPLMLEPMGGYWLNGDYQLDPAQPLMQGEFALRAALPSTPVALWGQLVFGAAQSQVSQQQDFQLGMEWQGPNGKLRLVRIETGRLLFAIEGSMAPLVGLRALAADGSLLSQGAQLRYHYGEARLELDVRQRPARIEFISAAAHKRLEFPFELRVKP